MAVKKQVSSRLGVDQSSLGKLTPADLKVSSTANMALSYLFSLEAENAELKIKVETQSTYVNAYDLSQNNSKISAFLALLSTISIGFSINLFTSNDSVVAAWALLIIGIALQAGSIMLALKR